MKRKLLAWLLILPLLTSPALAEEESVEFFDDVMRFTHRVYRFDVEDTEYYKKALEEVLRRHPEVLDDALAGAYDSLDPHSRYIAPIDSEKVMENLLGSFVGIGVYIIELDGHFTISAPIEGSPAIEAGILAGDVILRVEGEEVNRLSMDELVSKIRGEAGTYVTITIKRGDTETDFSVLRREIKVSPVTYRMEEQEIAYIRINSFNENTIAYFAEAVNTAEQDGARGVILDLRDNGGGITHEAMAVAEFFIPKDGVIITKKYKDERMNEQFLSEGPLTALIPVVLVNENSASSSEIVAGALKCHGVDLVGTDTFGKGTEQLVYALKNGGEVFLTAAAFHLPDDEWIHQKGVTPNYFVNNITQPIDTSEFYPLPFNVVLSKGESGERVLALKQRLRAIGIGYLTDDDVYDDSVAEAVRSFQEAMELHPYGVADLNTQIKLNDVVNSTLEVVDIQMEKALEIMREKLGNTPNS